MLEILIIKPNVMFWKKTPLQKLNKKYDALIKESYELSKIDRKQSDLKQAEAEEVLKEIQALEHKAAN